jgi:integrase
MEPVTHAVPLALLRAAFTSQHYPKLFAEEGTHDAARDLIASLAAHTQDSGLLTEIVASGLSKDYRGNTLREIDGMLEGALRKGFDKRDKQARSRSKTDAPKLIDIALEAAAGLFHDRDGRGFLSIAVTGGGLIHHVLGGEAAKLWLRRLVYQRTGKAIPRQTLDDLVQTLQAQAVFDGPLHEIAVRGAREGDVIYFDLGRRDAEIVRITAEGWSLTSDYPVKFIRPAGFGELPVPALGGNVQSLRDLLQLDDEAWVLVLAFLINCIHPGGPFFCLLVEGEQGSGKSLLCAIIKKIIDPSSVEKMRLPDSEQNLMIQAKDYYLLVFDNVSGMKSDISDALCMLATGGGMTFRKLYTDADRQVFNQVRAFIINGIGEFVHRPDLIERALLLSLPTMPEGARKTESRILEEFRATLPEILRGLPPAMPANLGRGKPKVKKAILAPDQVNLLLQAARGDREKGIYIAFPFLAGTRPSEQLGLLWEDVDFEANVIHIRRMQERDGSITNLTKTVAGTRDIPMCSLLRGMLMEWRLVCPRWSGELRRVFPGLGHRQAWPLPRTCGGGALLYWNFRARFWVPALRKLGLPVVTPHSARHCFISTLQAQGIEVGLVAKLAGHASAVVTLGHYTQAVRGAESAVAALERAFTA